MNSRVLLLVSLCVLALVSVSARSDSDVDVDVDSSAELHTHHELDSGLIVADPHSDALKNVQQLVVQAGLGFEEKVATTGDGYKLTVHRVFKDSAARKPVVMLQHGMLDTSATWVLNGRGESLAFILADAGYDVWMCNSRGNKYARDHTTLKSDRDAAFWKFDFDDHAKSDLPACVDLALSTAAQAKLSLISHSQGGLISFVALNTVAGFAGKINYYAALAPVTYLEHQRSTVFKLMADLHADALLSVVPAGELGELSCAPQLVHKSLAAVCSLPGGAAICNDFTGLLFGRSTVQDPARTEVYMGHWPDTTSRQNMVHWIKNARNKGFVNRDGQAYNPVATSNLQLPITVYAGKNDFLADPEDVNKLVSTLTAGGMKDVKLNSYENYSHMDFVWAKDPIATNTFHPDLLANIRRHNPTASSRFARIHRLKGGKPL